MASTCNVCGIHATEGQLFAVESIPFRGGRTYCPNCHARLQRRFFQAGLILDVALGVFGLALVLHNPSSRFGNCVLNLFLVQLFLAIATAPHELAHALAARWCKLRVEKVILGFGPPVWAGRMFGFNLEVKQIPYGGSTHVRGQEGRDQPWRHFFYFLSGPLASFVLCFVASELAAKRTGALDLTIAVSPWWLFSIASSTLAVHHLFPHYRTTPAGRMPSDGLALLQILFRRRVSSVAPAEAPRVPEINFARKFARRFGVAVFGTGAIVCFVCAAFVGKAAMGSSIGAAFWLAALAFAALGASFAWGAVWTYRKPWQPSRSHGLATLTRHSEVTQAFRMEVNARSFWPPNLDFDKALAAVEQAHQSGDFAGAEMFLDEAIRWAPDNVALLGWKGGVLSATGRHAEAAAQFASILESDDLGLSIRATFVAEHVKALLRAGQRQAAWICCGEFLDEPGLLPEKLYLLDSIAALPVQESWPGLLPDAEHWSAQALSMQPENLSLKVTRGAVFAEQGRSDEAAPLLAEVHSRSEIEADKGLAAFCLARCARQRGDARTAARLLRQARLLHPEPWLLKRIEAESLSKAA